MYNFVIYLIVMAIVIWTLDSINMNSIFKKNKEYQAKVFYIILVFSLTYLTSNFIISFLSGLK